MSWNVGWCFECGAFRLLGWKYGAVGGGKGRMNETLLEVGKLVCAVVLWMSVVVANGV